MKTLLTAIAVLFVFTVFENNVSAQVPNYDNNTLKKVEKMSISTMDSEINSLVESVIFNMVIFKMYKPEWDFDKIIVKLNDLSVNGNSVTIRYKAQLASMFISHYNMFDSVKIVDKSNPSEFFKQVADRFQHEMVAVK